MNKLHEQYFNRSFQLNWEKFIGDNYNFLLEKIQITKNSTIIEIAPGNSAAIGYGLSKFNFFGTLYIIEPTLFFSKKIKRIYKKLLPNAEIIEINALLSELKKNQYFKNKNIDLTISHHPLDDFIIGKLFPDLQNFNEFFTKYHTGININNAKVLAKKWTEALTKPKFIKQAMQETLEDWNYIINTSNALIISACNSYFYKTYSPLFPVLKYPDLFATILLKQLKSNLIQHSLIKINKNSIFQDPKYWLCAKR